jgi:simple sugar transport system substrate-binding protein
MKKKTLIMIVSVLVFALIFTGCAQTTDAGTQSSEGASEAAVESSASGEEASDGLEIVLIAKTEGIAWFDDMRTGVDEFGEEHPDVAVSQIAPEGGDPAKQAALVEDSIARGVDAICIVPNDPQSLIPAIQKAKEAGIIVITHEASTLQGTVDYDMEAFNNEDFGALYGENLAKAMDGKGKYLGIVGGLTMETHMQWYTAAVNYIKENYPDMELVAEQPYEDKIDATVAYTVAQEIMKAYPDLGGVLGMTVESGISFAKLLEETNNTNVKISCLALPSASGQYIKDGWISYGQCWRPADAGYVSVNIAYKMLNGEAIETGIDLEKDGYEDCTVTDGIVYGNAPIIFTADNVDSYPF